MSLLSLDDLYYMVARIYSEQNAQRPTSATFTHFVEVCGMLTIYDRDKKREHFTIEDAICKALGWFFPLLAKFKVKSAEELIFRKYPNVCPYCRKKTHEDAPCKIIRGTQQTVDHASLKSIYQKNKKKRPTGLDQWMQMFQDIYPRQKSDQVGRNTLGLLEELGELAEAIRVFDVHPKYFAGEAADVFSYIMGIANKYNLTLQEEGKEFHLEKEFLTRYPGMCIQCGYEICICPSIPESTIGRMAKELDLNDNDDLFQLDHKKLQERGRRISATVLQMPTGNSNTTSIPFDRGDANRAFITFCLKVSASLKDANPEHAEALRLAATHAGSTTKKAGAREHESFDSIFNALRRTDVSTDSTELSDNSAINSKLTSLIKKKKILFISAAPYQDQPVRLLTESEAKIAKDALKDDSKFFFNYIPAATVDDLRRELLTEGRYDIIHLAGHGIENYFLFNDASGHQVEVKLANLKDWLEKHKVECIILNACEIMKSMTESLGPITIGMTDLVTDRASMEFTRGFYDAIAQGKNVDIAIEEGKVAAKMKGFEKELPLKILPAIPRTVKSR